MRVLLLWIAVPALLCLKAVILPATAPPASASLREAPGPATGKVTFWRLPEGAIQPQSAVDSAGIVHVIYFRTGTADGVGNLYYVRRAPGDTSASIPIRVNSREHSAGCIGTVRTAQLAIGKDDRIHVVWNGLGPKAANGYPVAYQAYTRLNDSGTGFEPQRDLTTWATGLDGGGSVAADRKGNVYVTWHAVASAKDEAGAAVFVARSTDNGRTFSKEKQINPEPTGACGCCGMRAFADDKGVLYVLYRTATKKTARDTALLVSRDEGQTFAERRIHPWSINACPMSTYAMTESGKGVEAAWETEDRVYAATIDPANLSVSKPITFSGKDQKHPFIASSSTGETLVAWTEGTGWQRGGSLAWQVLDRSGKPVAAGRAPDAIPVWGLAATYAKADGGFVIVY